MKRLSVPERLTKNRFNLDEEECHIEVNQEIAKATGTGKALVACCPAHVYTEEPDGTISVEYAACLECGTCLAVAAPGALKWHYPRGGFGVQFREGILTVRRLGRPRPFRRRSSSSDPVRSHEPVHRRFDELPACSTAARRCARADGIAVAAATPHLAAG